jgi:hypothetical protein
MINIQRAFNKMYKSFDAKGKVALRLAKHHAMKMYRGVEI